MPHEFRLFDFFEDPEYEITSVQVKLSSGCQSEDHHMGSNPNESAHHEQEAVVSTVAWTFPDDEESLNMLRPDPETWEYTRDFLIDIDGRKQIRQSYVEMCQDTRREWFEDEFIPEFPMQATSGLEEAG